MTMNFRLICLIFIVVSPLLILNGCASKPILPPVKRPAEKIYVEIKQEKKDYENHLEKLFQENKHLFKRLKLRNHFFLTWSELKNIICATGNANNISKDAIQKAIYFVEIFQNNPSRIKKTLNHKYALIDGSKIELSKSKFTRINEGYITYEMSVMWRYLILDLKTRGLIQSRSRITSGYRSPAYQFYVMLKSGESLHDILKKAAPPYFSRHGQSSPDISVKLSYDQNSSDFRKSYNLFCLIAKKYGFEPSFPNNPHLVTEFRFKGIDIYYQPIRTSKYIQNSVNRKEFFKQFYIAMKRNQFYPPITFLKAIIILGELESSLTWNPPLSAKKKKKIKKKYQKYQPLIDILEDSLFVDLMLPKEVEVKKNQLLKRLPEIIDEKNDHISEYDLFIWSQTAYDNFNEFFNIPGDKYLKSFIEKNISLIGTLRYEPKTFGIFQIDINNMIYKMEIYNIYKTKFPFLFQKDTQNNLRVNRRKLVKFLCGIGARGSDKIRCLELVILTTLKPRFENHFLGNTTDVNYFIIEHLMGDMSTHRAAIQIELNKRVNSRLIIDGDLSHYYPHSLKVNYEKKSSSQMALETFCKKIGVNDNRLLIKQICDADSWLELKKTKLYMLLMKNNFGKRSLPTISSELYREKAKSYIFRVRRKMDYINLK